MFTTNDVFHSAIVKLEGIPWDLRVEEILNMLYPFVPIGQPPRLHIPIDVITGKTLSCAFIEIGTMENAYACVRHLESRRPILHGKAPRVTVSNHVELQNAFFSNGSLVREDVIKILTVCRNYKRQYNRRCPNRPFDYVISLIQIFSFDSIQEATQRDQIFEFHKNAVELLKIFTKKDFSYFRKDLLYSLVLCGVVCLGYTLKQREVLVRTSQINLPERYIRYLKDEETTGHLVRRLKRKLEVPLLGKFSGFGHTLIKQFTHEIQIPDLYDLSSQMCSRPSGVVPVARHSSYESNRFDSNSEIKRLTEIIIENQTRIGNIERAMKDLITIRQAKEAKDEAKDFPSLDVATEVSELFKCGACCKVDHLHSKLAALEPETQM
eukprot:NODE_1_length_95616_cov_0.657642.p20 type:complete len:380 gc:universal NODE_1_length_95616_cov_0.657642:68893-70032(+)